MKSQQIVAVTMRMQNDTAFLFLARVAQSYNLSSKFIFTLQYKIRKNKFFIVNTKQKKLHVAVYFQLSKTNWEGYSLPTFQMHAQTM